MELINKSDVINITAETGALETQSRVRQMPAIINIPNNATNGDVIKIMFPNECQILKDMFDFFDHTWCNASYKRGDTDVFDK